MARRRFQSPEPERSGKWWYLRYWQDVVVGGTRKRVRKRVKLAPASTPDREVKKIAAEHLRPLNQGLMTVGSAVTFNDYVEEVYKPTDLKLMASSTQDRYEGILRNYLVPSFGELALRELTPLTVQRYFSNKVADSNLQHESRDKIRDVMSSVLASAVKYGYLVTNPVEGVVMPVARKGRRSKPYVTPQQFANLLKLIPEPYATMVFVAVYTGLRVSELIALKWRNVHLHADAVTVEERYCRGDWSAPKSWASNATIPVPRTVIERIEALRSMEVAVRAGRAVRRYRVVKSSAPDDLVFQSVAKGGPMRDNNILCRFIKPAGKALGIPWVNWRSLRTSYATWLKLAGADVKDAQGLLRHSRASTTLDFYQQFVPESERKAVEKLGRLGVELVN